MRPPGEPLRQVIWSLFMRRDGSEEQICSTNDTRATMSSTPTHTGDNTDEARFLAPETHQKAGGHGAACRKSL
jgi:hypothetical protein